jgi:archaellum component FlaC
MVMLFVFSSEYIPAIIIASIIFIVQVAFFFGTNAKIRKLREIFPATPLNKNNVRSSSPYDPDVEITVHNEASEELKSIVGSINEYLKASKGTSEFDVIKSITEEEIGVLSDEIASRINIPLYTGLMGTFLGIIIGLLAILLRNDITQQSIMTFIGGILIAMGASLVGLFLTVRSNTVNLKRAKTTSERGKNTFFRFLRTDILAHSTKGLSEVVVAFRENINKFNASFGSNVKLFDEKLSENIKSLAQSVTLVSNNIIAVNSNTQSNIEILKALQTEKFQKMVNANMQLVEVINGSIPNFTEFFEKQKEVNTSVDKTLVLASTINTIMDRVKRFEDSINDLGDSIDKSDYMGSDLLAKVEKHLKDLDQQFTLLKQHSQTTSGQIEVHFASEVKKIEELSKKVLSELQAAMDFNVEKNPFTKLELLESIDQSLKDTQYKLNAIKSMKEQQSHFHENGQGGPGPRRKKTLINRIFPFIRRRRG